MSLITNNSTPPSPPTLEEQQAAYKARVISQINGLYAEMKRVYSDLYNSVWSNPQWTPQTVIDSFGTDAYELFRLAVTLQTVVNGVTPNALPGAPLPYTVNQNGTITVDMPSSSSSSSSVSDESSASGV